MTDAFAIRRLDPADIEAAHVINQACVPAVGSLTAETLAAYLAQAISAPAAYDGDTLAGFLICLGEGANYDSLNYDWVSARFDTFAYVDRIAFDAAYRNRGLGDKLYRAALAEIPVRHEQLICEVNLAPPNPGSQRFHDRLGFKPIGERWTEDRAKGVVYLARPLAG
ncbi:MAG: GNAT family N-acetyltransferase [Pseudomonadota bacterium]